MAAQVTVVSIVLTTGASAQAAVPQPSPPGTIVDIGGQALHLNCTGSGSPTVVLENGAGDYSFVWALVQPEVATHTRVCSYDRAGYAWSQPGRLPRTFAQLALELRTALSRLNEQGPFVLVGQSYGGVVVRGFAERYPKEVAGMVLVDATHEDQHSVWGGQPHLLRADAKGRAFPAPIIAGLPWAKMDSAIAAGSESGMSISADSLEAERRPTSTTWRVCRDAASWFTLRTPDTTFISKTRGVSPNRSRESSIRSAANATFAESAKDICAAQSHVSISLAPVRRSCGTEPDARLDRSGAVRPANP